MQFLMELRKKLSDNEFDLHEGKFLHQLYDLYHNYGTIT